MSHILFAILFSFSSGAHDFQDFETISVMFGSRTEHDRVSIRDIIENRGRELQKVLSSKLEANQSVLLTAETVNFRLAIFTGISRVTGSNDFRVTYTWFEKKKKDIWKKIKKCLEGNPRPIDRLSCYQSEDYETKTLNDSSSNLAFIISGRFTDRLRNIPFGVDNIAAAATHFGSNLTPIGRLIDQKLRFYPALLAQGLMYDWNEPVFWRQRTESDRPADLEQSRKFFAATVRLDADNLYYGTYNLQCSTDGKFPGPGKRKIKTDTMIAGPIILTPQEMAKYVTAGKCRHYVVGVDDQDLYELLEEMGYSYDSKSAVWLK